MLYFKTKPLMACFRIIQCIKESLFTTLAGNTTFMLHKESLRVKAIIEDHSVSRKWAGRVCMISVTESELLL